MNRSVLKSLKSKRSGPKSEKNWSGNDRAKILYFAPSSGLSYLFRAGPKLSSIVRAGLEKSSPCRPELESDKVKEKKRNHACVLRQFRGADSLFCLLHNLYIIKTVMLFMCITRKKNVLALDIILFL